VNECVDKCGHRLHISTIYANYPVYTPFSIILKRFILQGLKGLFPLWEPHKNTPDIIRLHYQGT